MSETKAASKDNLGASKLSFGERTGRLVLITTILGVLGLIYFKILAFALNNLTDRIYLNHLISIEHVFASCLLSTASLILLHVLRYWWCELVALNYTIADENNSEAFKFINRANLSYAAIFKSTSLYLIFSVITVLLYFVVRGFLVSNFLIIGFTLFIVVVNSIFLFLKKFRKSVLKGVRQFKKYIHKNWGNISVWLLLTFLMLYYLIIGMSLNQKATFTVSFSNNEALPIKLNFENSPPNTINIQFYAVDEDNNELLTKELTVDELQFKRSFIEVTERPVINTTPLLTLLDVEIKKGSLAYLSSKSHYDFNYEINARNYLKQGINFIIIKFNRETLNNSEYYKIVNQVDLDHLGNVLINKQEFKEYLNESIS